MLEAKHFTLTRRKMLTFLDELAATGGEGRSLFLSPVQTANEIETLLAEVVGIKILPDMLQ